MPKAGHTDTTHRTQTAARTPKRSTDRPAAGGPPLSIATLGLALAAAEAGPTDIEEASSPENRGAAARLDAHQDALRFLISTLPATTLADAAIQLGTATALTHFLEGSDWDEPDSRRTLRDIHTALQRIALSVLPVVAQAAGLDPKAWSWMQNQVLRARLFPAAEAGA